MEKFLTVLAVIAFIAFIAYNVYEIILANMFYKRMTREHKEVIDKIIAESVNKMFGDKNEDNK